VESKVREAETDVGNLDSSESGNNDAGEATWVWEKTTTTLKFSGEFQFSGEFPLPTTLAVAWRACMITR
jgi:hypothetical protein